MDEATIEAMRAVVGFLEKHAADIKDSLYRVTYVCGAEVPICQFRLAAEGFKALVDKAAAERAEPVAAGGENDLLERFTEDLEDAMIAADKHKANSINLVTTACFRPWSQVQIGEIIRAIKAMFAARPTPPATPAEPTIEECVAAINRAGFLGGSDWSFVVKSPNAGVSISVADARLTGDWLIERERAAKGGAA